MIFNNLRVLVFLLFSLFIVITLPLQLGGEPIKGASKNILSIKTILSTGALIGTSKGLSYIDPSGKLTDLKGPMDPFYVSALATDFLGIAWVSTAKGIYTYDQGKKIFKPIVKDIPASAITIGKNNVVWGGTMGQGIVKIVKNKPVNWYHAKTGGLPSNQVLTLLTSSDGEIWAGSTKGLAVFEGSKWKSIPSLQGRLIYSMAEQSDNLFVGTDDGVYYAKDQKKTWTIIPGTKGKVITAVHSSKKYMLFGTSNGEALMYSKGTIYSFPKVLGIKGVDFPKRAITSFATIGPKSQTLLLGSFGDGIKFFSTEEWIKEMLSKPLKLPKSLKFPKFPKLPKPRKPIKPQ